MKLHFSYYISATAIALSTVNAWLAAIREARWMTGLPMYDNSLDVVVSASPFGKIALALSFFTLAVIALPIFLGLSEAKRASVLRWTPTAVAGLAALVFSFLALRAYQDASAPPYSFSDDYTNAEGLTWRWSVELPAPDPTTFFILLGCAVVSLAAIITFAVIAHKQEPVLAVEQEMEATT
mgnify:CR=1 FL=1